jgi:hypothetical protein
MFIISVKFENILPTVLKYITIFCSKYLIQICGKICIWERENLLYFISR